MVNLISVAVLFLAIPLAYVCFNPDSSQVARVASVFGLMSLTSMLIGLGAAVGF